MFMSIWTFTLTKTCFLVIDIKSYVRLFNPSLLHLRFEITSTSFLKLNENKIDE